MTPREIVELLEEQARTAPARLARHQARLELIRQAAIGVPHDRIGVLRDGRIRIYSRPTTDPTRRVLYTIPASVVAARVTQLRAVTVPVPPADSRPRARERSGGRRHRRGPPPRDDDPEPSAARLERLGRQLRRELLRLAELAPAEHRRELLRIAYSALGA